VDAIYLAGTFGGVIMSILPVMMINKARVAGDRTPEWENTWTVNKGVQGTLIVLFCAAAAYAILDLVGILPSGW
jgi:hypothetical protein